MTKARLALGSALMAAVGIVIGINSFPFEDGSLFVARAVMAFIGLFAISAAILLVSTLFRAADDLWETTFFRYMRAFWGSSWGGNVLPLRISVCRATWLILLTFLAWLPMIILFAFSIFLAVGSLLNGVYFFRTSGKELAFLAQLVSLFSIELLLLTSLVIFVLFNLYRKSIFNAFFAEKQIRNVLFWSLLAVGSIEFLLILVAVPIQSVGLEQFLMAVASGLLWIIAFAAAVGVIVGFIWLISKTSKAISEHTVPAILARKQLQGLKGKFCPFFIQGDKSASKS